MTDYMKLTDILLDELPEEHPWKGNIKGLVEKLIAHGVTVQEWISVKDRLPEECGVFLVCGNRGGIYTAEFRKFSDFGGEYPHWHKLNSKNHHCEPTHWMPLPQPPKPE